MMIFAGMDLLARNLIMRFAPDVALEAPVPISSPAPSPVDVSHLSLRDLDLHPDHLYEPYFSGLISINNQAPQASRRILAFRKLLERYRVRQVQDDNFTIRVIDNRTNATLEVFSLKEDRNAHRLTHVTDWRQVDRDRAKETRRLTKKYRARGFPRQAITIKWGRANQVAEARERDAPFVEYEIRLAAQLGLSLLATEIGAVETFNDDRLVSRVGARSRYQIMPYLLRKNDIHHYLLRTSTGTVVAVFEEWNPLLTMEPAFLLMRGYANAVGHEIPGLSAYHAGPFNLFKIYEAYIAQAHPTDTAPRVLDAFIWGLTDGYNIVSKRTYFRAASRGYVPAAYGTLLADEDYPIDTTLTVLAERVQFRDGYEIDLRDLLTALENAGLRPPRDADRSASLYNQFRALNPHFVLPPAPDSAGVPDEGNVHLVARVGTAHVRFFLPSGSSRRLKDAGIDLIDPRATMRFDHNTYAVPPDHFQTRWDRAYDRLVQRISNFGFTNSNRTLLDSLVIRFDDLATANPSSYRLRQQRVIHTHADVWQSRWWVRLAQTTSANAGRLRARVQPPDHLRTTDPPN